MPCITLSVVLRRNQHTAKADFMRHLMNGFKDERAYRDYLARRAKARELGAWEGGTIVTNLLTCNLKATRRTQLTNSNPNPQCFNRKTKRKCQH
jgi:hypothetical protein